MILTITTNPSVDIIYKVPYFSIGKTNRENEHSQVAGGKGVNAARVAAILMGGQSETVAATGFIGKENRRVTSADLRAYGVGDFFIPVTGRTRYCYQILDENGSKTELNEIGSEVNSNSLQELISALDQATDVKAVSINGSIAPGLPADTYQELIAHLRQKFPQAKVILDTSGASLKTALSAQLLPDIIKPNNDELSALLGYEVFPEAKAALRALHDPLFTNMHTIVVSLGATGAAVKIGRERPRYYFVKTRELNEVNAEGSGDATVGGMLYAIDQGLDALTTVRYGMAAGMANVLESKTGFVDPRNVSAFIEDDSQIIVQEEPILTGE
jgi:tagatose 6-phosphate kinase